MRIKGIINHRHCSCNCIRFALEFLVYPYNYVYIISLVITEITEIVETTRKNKGWIVSLYVAG